MGAGPRLPFSCGWGWGGFGKTLTLPHPSAEQSSASSWHLGHLGPHRAWPHPHIRVHVTEEQCQAAEGLTHCSCCPTHPKRPRWLWVGDGGGVRGPQGWGHTPGLGFLVLICVRVLVLRVLTQRPAPCHESPCGQEAGGIAIACVLDEAGHCGRGRGQQAGRVSGRDGSVCRWGGGQRAGWVSVQVGRGSAGGTGQRAGETGVSGHMAGPHTNRSRSTGRTGTRLPLSSRPCPGAS